MAKIKASLYVSEIDWVEIDDLLEMLEEIRSAVLDISESYGMYAQNTSYPYGPVSPKLDIEIYLRPEDGIIRKTDLDRAFETFPAYSDHITALVMELIHAMEEKKRLEEEG
jgi:hypothetical protein